ncbi:MAG: histidine phosphatase family protein [Thermodesulfovibrionales bacterium]|nr:histidine phosphatase family protein [Thermodesulfovibrionales bacterium]
MVTTLYLIRHGATAGDDVKRYKGSIDVPLSERGVEQINRSLNFIQEHSKKTVLHRQQNYLVDIHGGQTNGDGTLKAVYCSPLSRAVKSAEIIANHYGIRPIEVADLTERNFGSWEGMTYLEIKEKFPEEFSKWASNPLKYCPPGGESTIEVRDRVIKAIENIVNIHKVKGDNIAVVAHGGVNRIILCYFMGVPLENIFRIEQDHASVNIIEFWDRYPVIKLVNGVYY